MEEDYKNTLIEINLKMLYELDNDSHNRFELKKEDGKFLNYSDGEIICDILNENELIEYIGDKKEVFKIRKDNIELFYKEYDNWCSYLNQKKIKERKSETRQYRKDSLLNFNYLFNRPIVIISFVILVFSFIGVKSCIDNKNESNHQENHQQDILQLDKIEKVENKKV